MRTDLSTAVDVALLLRLRLKPGAKLERREIVELRKGLNSRLVQLIAKWRHALPVRLRDHERLSFQYRLARGA